MKWISVKDKMPELLQDVLVIKDCDEPVYKIAHTDYNRFTNEITMWDVDGLDFYLPIDYFDCWMPLPEPPQAEPKSCVRCEHYWTYSTDRPCIVCKNYSHYQPKEK